ncbi:hypothetical protein CIK05_11505 [Bdellovibrio sp. qaytius]|nr:hypothetical protein CIK05_11505 [Bdellovibrio sp. qaytius]
MAIFLDWFASHNTLVIQSLAGIVALLIVFLIFRLLFTSNDADSASAKNVTYAQLEEKLNKLLEQQAQMKFSVAAVTDAPTGDILGADALAALSGDPAAAAAVAATAAAAGAATGEQAAELSRLRAEITTLKDSVKRKEVEILDAKETAQKSINTAQADAKLNDLSGKMTDYEKEIEALKGRLSDYEIIAEDIADLQQFKKENQELKNQLANMPTQTLTVESAEISEKAPTPAPAAVVKAEPIVEVEPTAEDLLAELDAADATAAAAVVEAAVTEEPEEVIEEPKKEEPHVPEDLFAVAKDIMDETSIADSEPEDEEMPEATASRDLDNAEAREVSKGVNKEEKILLDEFEKHFAKDED